MSGPVYVVGDSNSLGYPQKAVFEKVGFSPSPAHLAEKTGLDIRTIARSGNTYSVFGGDPCTIFAIPQLIYSIYLPLYSDPRTAMVAASVQRRKYGEQKMRTGYSTRAALSHTPFVWKGGVLRAPIH